MDLRYTLSASRLKSVLVGYCPASGSPTRSFIHHHQIPLRQKRMSLLMMCIITWFHNGGTNYQSGVKYTYSTSSLSIGEHYYTFQFDDGTGPADFGGQPIPAITPITLAHSSVSPTSGVSTTVFTFQTTYRDATGQAPVTADLYVDNVVYPMTYLSGSYKSGAVFQLSKTLPTGNHSFFFVFADSQSSWVDPFAPSTYAGPNVGLNAQPVAPGTLITPDGDQNPDIPLPGDSDG